MKRWLDAQFPTSHAYDTYNIVFSPLVAYNQSGTSFHKTHEHVRQSRPYARQMHSTIRDADPDIHCPLAFEFFKGPCGTDLPSPERCD